MNLYFLLNNLYYLFKNVNIFSNYKFLLDITLHIV